LASGVNNGGLGASIAAGLSGGIKKSELEKAKVDEGKTKSKKIKARAARGNEDGQVRGREKGVHSLEEHHDRTEVTRGSGIKGSSGYKDGVSPASGARDHAEYTQSAKETSGGSLKQYYQKAADSGKASSLGEHKKVISEQKAMKAPTLPKSERMMNKSELKAGMSFNDLKKSEVTKKPEEKIISISELKKREDDMMAMEDKVNSVAAHIKDILKKIK
jgi:hypothetical protein